MKTTDKKINDWLERTCKFVYYPICGEDKYAHVSVIDDSYVARVDSEPTQIVLFLAEKNMGQMQAAHRESVANIGFCAEEQKWYGWNYRGAGGFGVGDSVRAGDVGFSPSNADEFLINAVNFWTGEYRLETSGVEASRGDKLGVVVSWVYDTTVPSERLRHTRHCVFCEYPPKWGRGEWTARTLADAKQMARDYASGANR